MALVAHFVLASVLLAVLGSSWDKVVAADDVSQQICQTAYSQANILLRHIFYCILFFSLRFGIVSLIHFISDFLSDFVCHHAFCVGVICVFPRQFTCHLKAINTTFNYNCFQYCKYTSCDTVTSPILD